MHDDQLVYDYTLMMADSVGEHGVTAAELAALEPCLDAAHQQFLDDKDNTRLGFALLPYQDVTPIHSLASRVRRDFTTLLVLGIGGSDLGARAVHQALNHTYYNEFPNQSHKLYFAGANTDPKALADLLDILDLERTAVNVISKSGDTIETMASFVLICERLRAVVGEAMPRHIIITTDAEHGTLRQLVQREGYQSLVIPNDVGGRFSVLSAVGLFPLAFAGIEIEALLQGAQDMDERLSASPVRQNPALLYAGLQYFATTTRGQHLSVLMPYGDGLRGVAQWYRQLWAESLGKRLSTTGEEVFVGPTPIASVGATDQHSQVQLYNEGPFDKVITFIRVESWSRNVTLDEVDIDELAYLQGLEFGEILQTECQATAVALAQHGRPSATLILPRLDEASLGSLLYFFEVACAYSGTLYGINAYDQPGVEAGKQAMYALLGRPGYEEQAKALTSLLHPDTPYRV